MISYEEILKKFSAVFIFLMLIHAAACASGQAENNSKKTNKVLFKDNGNIVVRDGDTKYRELLVDINSYSTNGNYYQKKYDKLLLSLAGEIIEEQDLEVSRGSIGFYYDKKSKRTDRLFFGVDINTERDENLDYGRFSVRLIKENVGGIVDLMYKYKSILDENEIVGIVIGFKWSENSGSQQVNIWMNKEDLYLFYQGKITSNEMYQRSTITNSAGKIILLPI